MPPLSHLAAASSVAAFAGGPHGPWHDGLLLGHGPMDAEHEVFLSEVAALQAADDDALGPRLDAVAVHAGAHFGQEDRWMRESGFPAGACHAGEHAAVLRSIQSVRARLAQGDTAAVRRLAAELLAWFPAHVIHLDSALAHWLNKRRLGGKPIVVRRRMQDASTLAGHEMPTGDARC